MVKEQEFEPTKGYSFDLHVLGLPLAFILSQDQTHFHFLLIVKAKLALLLKSTT